MSDLPETLSDDQITDRDGESRWPMAGGGAGGDRVDAALPGTLGSRRNIRVLPLLEVGLLLALVFGDPGRIDRRSKALRRCSLALVGVLVSGALLQTVVLAAGLIDGDSHVQSASALLQAGAEVWVANNIAFAPALLGARLRRRGRARALACSRIPTSRFPSR